MLFDDKTIEIILDVSKTFPDICKEIVIELVRIKRSLRKCKQLSKRQINNSYKNKNVKEISLSQNKLNVIEDQMIQLDNLINRLKSNINITIGDLMQQDEMNKANIETAAVFKALKGYKSAHIGIVYADNTFCTFCTNKTRKELLVRETITFFTKKDGLKHSILGYKCPICNRVYLTSEQFSSLQNTVNIDETTITPHFKKEQLPSQISSKDAIVISNIIYCTRKGHKVNDLFIRLPLITSDGKRAFVKVSASFCWNCNRIVVLRSEYESIQSNGIPNCRIVDERKFIKLSEDSWENFIPSDNDTLFTQRGYNVNGIDNIPKLQRQEILRQILVNRELSKSEVLSYLDTLISRGEKRENWETAVSRWKEDKIFVMELKLHNVPDVEIDKIVIKGTKQL